MLELQDQICIIFKYPFHYVFLPKINLESIIPRGLCVPQETSFQLVFNCEGEVHMKMTL